MALPDAFNKIDHYQHLRKDARETYGEFIVREDETFYQLQQALRRLRKERVEERRRRRQNPAQNDDYQAVDQEEPIEILEEEDEEPEDDEEEEERRTRNGFFDDEIRGYRLLKACSFTRTERNQVLSVTRNRTNYDVVGRAIRTQFEDDHGRQSGGHAQKGQRAWWNDQSWNDQDWDEGWDENE